jgi:hypothetical protein
LTAAYRNASMRLEIQHVFLDKLGLQRVLNKTFAPLRSL